MCSEGDVVGYGSGGWFYMELGKLVLLYVIDCGMYVYY